MSEEQDKEGQDHEHRWADDGECIICYTFYPTIVADLQDTTRDLQARLNAAIEASSIAEAARLDAEARIRELEAALKAILKYEHGDLDCMTPTAHAVCRAHMHRVFDSTRALLSSPSTGEKAPEVKE